MNRRKVMRTLDAPLAITSTGRVLVNANQLGRGKMDVATMIQEAVATGMPVFIGVAVPASSHAGMLRELDDAAANIAGRHTVKMVRRRSRS